MHITNWFTRQITSERTMIATIFRLSCCQIIDHHHHLVHQNFLSIQHQPVMMAFQIKIHHRSSVSSSVSAVPVSSEVWIELPSYAQSTATKSSNSTRTCSPDSDGQSLASSPKKPTEQQECTQEDSTSRWSFVYDWMVQWDVLW